MKILGYEDITILRQFNLAPGKKILLYREGAKSKTAYPFGILFESAYNGGADYDVEREGAFVYKTMAEAIDEFAAKIKHYLTCTMVDGERRK